MTDLNPSGPLGEIPSPEEPVDYLALQAEFENIQRLMLHVNTLEQIKDRVLTPEEQQLIADIPEKCRRAVTITRILRRTNTGPARATPRRGKASKAQQAAIVDSLLNM